MPVMVRRTMEQEAMSISKYYAQVDAFERELLQQALDDARGDRAKAARAIGLSLVTFELKSERLGIGCRLVTPPPRGEW